jgi:membrane protein DedA with SNARE-associated domain
MMDHAQWIVLGLIFANQAGAPVFTTPALLGVGALVWTGDVSVAFATAAAMGASLCADLGWYSVGKWRGHWARAALRRLSRGASVLVDDAQRLFLAHDRAFQLGARFVPELNPVAAAFAGVAGIGLKRFVPGAAATAAIWAGTWIGVGYLIASTTWTGTGSGISFLAIIVAVSLIASLSLVIRRALRALSWISRAARPKASARTGDARRRADRVVGERKSPC